ncbi:hypothetical protein V6N13_034609 [Hibiscus sabdariffa]
MLLSQSNLLNEPSRIITDRPPDNLAPPVDPGLEGLVRSLVHGSEDRMVEGFVTDHFPVLERLGVLVDAVDLQPAKRDIDGQSLVGNDGVAVSGNVGSLRSYAGVVSNAGKEAVVASVLSLDDVTVSDGERLVVRVRQIRRTASIVAGGMAKLAQNSYVSSLLDVGFDTRVFSMPPDEIVPLVHVDVSPILGVV